MNGEIGCAFVDTGTVRPFAGRNFEIPRGPEESIKARITKSMEKNISVGFGA